MNEPIHVALPNTTEEKMKAIASVARAIENISKALILTNVNVNISNCTITDSETGITVDSPESG